jgi:DNA ligase-1
MAGEGIVKGPMLAVEVDLEKLTFPCYGSPKLDGVRATCHHETGAAMSRNNIAIPCDYVQEQFGMDWAGLDGELIVGPWNAKDVFNRTTRNGVMTEDAKPDFQFVVFDYYNDPNPNRPYEERYERLRWAFDNMPKSVSRGRLVLLQQVLITSLDHLTEYAESNIEAGYEGTMVRRRDGIYKFGRSTAKQGYLLKVKKFQDDEAIIVGAEELMSNQNEAEIGEVGQTKRSTKKEGLVPMNMLGALVVKDVKTGVFFNIGSGFDMEMRAYLWEQHKSGELYGKIVTYKHFPIGAKDKPRFPIFKGIRHPADTPALKGVAVK